MKVAPVKTPRILAKKKNILEVIDAALPRLQEGSIIAVTSKIVAICEGSVMPKDALSKSELVKNASEIYLPAALSKYGHNFTITRNTLIPNAGIDESNGEGYYILWPRDAQKTANKIREHLAKKHGLKNIGVVITDSTCQPMRRGTQGISLAHSGFVALNNYVGKPDLFGRPMTVTQSNIAGGLAATAVLAMGEGAEQTPLCVITDVPFVMFQGRNPTARELNEARISLEDDLFAPFLTAVKWQSGTKKD